MGLQQPLGPTSVGKWRKYNILLENLGSCVNFSFAHLESYAHKPEFFTTNLLIWNCWKGELIFFRAMVTNSRKKQVFRGQGFFIESVYESLRKATTKIHINSPIISMYNAQPCSWPLYVPAHWFTSLQTYFVYMNI